VKMSFDAAAREMDEHCRDQHLADRNEVAVARCAGSSQYDGDQKYRHGHQDREITQNVSRRVLFLTEPRIRCDPDGKYDRQQTLQRQQPKEQSIRKRENALSMGGK
jgi:hypothetical protein